VIRPHGTLDTYHRNNHRARKALAGLIAEKRILRGAVFIHCTSESERRAIAALNMGLRLEVIPLGVAVPLVDGRPAESLDSAATGDSVDSLVQSVLFLGRLSKKKGVDLLIQAFATIHGKMPTTELVIAGPDSEGLERGLRDLASTLNLTRSIRFVGEVSGDRKWSLFRNASVFALPSADENFGVAAAEALAVGVPVVLSREVALSEQVEAVGAGLVCARNPEDISTSVLRILTDHALAERCSASAKEFARETLSWDAIAKGLEAKYQEAISKHDCKSVLEERI